MRNQTSDLSLSPRGETMWRDARWLVRLRAWNSVKHGYAKT
ncbi:hypothetical protein [Methylocucumis oryzae]|nr:hypothetical protein [Methylocucumis oryzae]